MWITALNNFSVSDSFFLPLLHQFFRPGFYPNSHFMEEEEFDHREEEQLIKKSVQRYEEMLRKKDEYFFDVDAFISIIDNYIEKNDPVNAMQVIEFASHQHPSSVDFLLKKAQILAMTNQPKKA